MEDMNVQENQVAQESQAESPSIDYDKLASIIDGKIKVTEDSVLKGYMKQQGLTGDEMNQAIEMFKQDRASKMPDYNALNQQITDLQSAYDNDTFELESRALFAEMQMEAMYMAGELGVDMKKVPFLLNNANIENVIENGSVNREALKEALDNVLQDLPELRSQIKRDEKSNGFRIGADTSKQSPTNNDELARIFGVKR